jgi:hypothetical protein
MSRWPSTLGWVSPLVIGPQVLHIEDQGEHEHGGEDRDDGIPPRDRDETRSRRGQARRHRRDEDRSRPPLERQVAEPDDPEAEAHEPDPVGPQKEPRRGQSQAEEPRQPEPVGQPLE